MVSESVQNAFQRGWWALVIRGLLAIALGILILLRPLDSVAAFALVVAIWAIFGGITQIVYSIDLRHVFGSWWVNMLAGFVSVGFGVAALYYYPGLSLAFAVTWTSFWLMFSGIFGVAAAITEYRLGLSWGWTLVWGLVAIAAGVFALMSPPTTLAAIMGLIAGFALVSGTVLLIGAFRIRSAVGEIRQSVGEMKRA